MPRSSQSGIAGFEDGVLVVRLHAPPSDGKANEELLRLLARSIGVPPSSVAIQRGANSRVKDLVIGRIGEETLRARLAQWRVKKPAR